MFDLSVCNSDMGTVVKAFKAEIVIKFAEDPELTKTEYFVPTH